MLIPTETYVVYNKHKNNEMELVLYNKTTLDPRQLNMPQHSKYLTLYNFASYLPFVKGDTFTMKGYGAKDISSFIRYMVGDDLSFGLQTTRLDIFLREYASKKDKEFFEELIIKGDE